MNEKKLITKLLILIMGFFFTLAFAGHESILWKYQTNGKIHSTPLLHKNILYIGSFDKNFYAIDIKTHELKWKFEAADKILTTAVIYDSIVCFESGNILYGLNLKGDSIWSYKLYYGAVVNQRDRWDCFRSSPALNNNIVYIGSEEGWIFGFNILNGEKVFEYQTPKPNHTIKTTPLIYNHKIYFGDWDGEFYSVGIDTHKKVWSYDTKNDNTYSKWVNAITTDPIIYKDNVIFGGRSCNLYCLNAENGLLKWKYNEPNKWMVGGPTIDNSKVYMGGSYQRIAYCFDASGGKKLWTVETGNLVYGKPIATKTKILAGVSEDGVSNIGHLAVIDKMTHKIVDTINFRGQVFSTPVLYNNVIYVGSSNGYIYAIDNEKLTGEKDQIVAIDKKNRE